MTSQSDLKDELAELRSRMAESYSHQLARHKPMQTGFTLAVTICEEDEETWPCAVAFLQSCALQAEDRIAELTKALEEIGPSLESLLRGATVEIVVADRQLAGPLDSWCIKSIVEWVEHSARSALGKDKT